MKHKDIISKIDSILSADECNVNLYFLFSSGDAQILKEVKMTDEARAQILELSKSTIIDFRNKLKPDEDAEIAELSSANSKSQGIFRYDYGNEETLPFFDFITEADTNQAIDYWSENNGKTYMFKDAKFSCIDSIIYSIGIRTSHLTYFRKNYVLNTFAQKEKIKYIVHSKDTLDVAPDEVLRLDGKIDVLKLNDEFIINNLSMVQKDGNFQRLIKKDAKALLDTIKAWDIISDYDILEKCADDLNVSMKLASIKNRSTYNQDITKEQIIEFIDKRPSLKKSFNLAGGKISVKSKNARKFFLHILGDDYVSSLLDNGRIYVTENKKNAPEAYKKKK